MSEAGKSGKSKPVRHFTTDSAEHINAAAPVLSTAIASGGTMAGVFVRSAFKARPLRLRLLFGGLAILFVTILVVLVFMGWIGGRP